MVTSRTVDSAHLARILRQYAEECRTGAPSPLLLVDDDGPCLALVLHRDTAAHLLEHLSDASECGFIRTLAEALAMEITLQMLRPNQH